MTAPPREICANCGQPKSEHYIVNFADGPQISGPVWLCTGGVYATPAPSAEPPATDAPCSSCGQTAGFHTLRCRDKNAASELRATHCSNEGLHDSAADLIERQAREIAAVQTLLHDTEDRIMQMRAENVALRELLRKVLHATSANMSMDMYAEVCAAIDAERAKVKP